ncbi:MAG: type II toxin-antitoxin system PemK/MazF family toxin [Chloroflexi bacterium]|nr:type II toxin-antitoxin system PemK/MazF family toxin [Chloroflexota bacterium]
MNIGDIYAVEIPPSNGHEQAGTRPAVIIQSPRFELRLPTVLIVPLTSQLKAQMFPGTFVIEPDAANRLTTRSVALVFQLRAIDKRRLKNQIGKLGQADLTLIQSHIKQLIQIEEEN